MQFPVSPWGHFLTPIAWFFLVYVGVLLPVLAIRAHGRSKDMATLPSRTRLYVSALFTHAVFLILVFAVSRDLDVNPLASVTLRPVHWLVGAAGLVVGLLPLLRTLQLDNPVGKERAKAIAPRTAGEHAFFYVICASAGIAEELAYRGILFTLLAILIGNWWIAAIISSAVFGVAHLFQGWKSAGMAGLMGLREHIVVGLTGTLFVAMVVHFLHDVITGTVISWRVRRAEALNAVS